MNGSLNEFFSAVRNYKGHAWREVCDSLLRHLPGMAYCCHNDPGWTMLYVSDGAQVLTGYPPQAFLGADGLKYASLIHPSDRRQVWMSIQKALDTGSMFTIEYRIRTAAGEEKWVLEKGSGVNDVKGKEVINGFIQDITDHRRMEEEQVEKVRLQGLFQKADSLNRMAGAVAHHFNNKLHSVVAALELAQDEPGDGSMADDALALALESARSAVWMSRLMLTFLGEERQKRSRLSLNLLCQTICPALPERVTLEVDVPDEDLFVSGHEHSLRQVLEHLLINAGEADETTRIHLKLAAAGPDAVGPGVRFPVDWKPAMQAYAVLEVEDDGPGISASMVEQIFDPFFSTKFPGRGMGLALVLGLIRVHEGGVLVNSVLGRGSVFRVFLPLDAAGHP